MPRPKNSDPKIPLTLRLETSEVARWQAMGDDWRARMEATLKAGPYDPATWVVPATWKPEARPADTAAKGQARGVLISAPATPATEAVRVSVPLGTLGNRGPRPKLPGKAK